MDTKQHIVSYKWWNKLFNPVRSYFKLKNDPDRWEREIFLIVKICLMFCLVFLLGNTLYEHIFKSIWAFLALQNCVALQITVMILCLSSLYWGINTAGKVIDVYHVKVLCLTFIIYIYYRFFFDYHDDDYKMILLFWNLDGFALVGICAVIGFVGMKIYRWHKSEVKNSGSKNTSSDSEAIIPPYFDDPITDETDDLFHFSKLAKSLAFTIQQNSFNHSYSIGVSSPWGTGKTSFLNLLKKELRSDKSVVIVEFNARSSANAECIQADFLSLLASKLASFHTGMKSVVKDYMEDINVLVSDTALAKILGLIHIQDATDSRRKLQKGICAIGKKIVVMIDDLDRLTNLEILEVLKLITKNAAFKNVVFITTYDKVYVNRILEKSFVDATNQQFTDKYFNMEINLPKGNGEIRSNYLLKEFIKLVESKCLTACKEYEFREIVKREKNFIERYLLTLRDVKRFLNTFCASYVPIQEEVYFRDYLLLSLLRYADKILYDKIKDRQCLDVIDGYGNKNIYVLKEVDKLDDKDKDVLSFLFPNRKAGNIEDLKTKGQKHIYWKRSFNTYFYNLEYTNLHQKDLSKLLKANIKDRDIRELAEDWKERKITIDIKDYLIKIEDYQNDQEQLKAYLRLCMICFRYTEEKDIFFTTSHYFYYYSWENIKNKFHFKTKDEYKNFLSDILQSSSDINASSVFLHHLLYSQLSEVQLDAEECVFTDEELKIISLYRLKEGIDELKDQLITGSDVLYLVMSCLDDAAPSDSGSYGFKVMEKAFALLKLSIEENPQEYLYSTITHKKANGDLIQFYMNEVYPFGKIFTFEELKDVVNSINDENNNTLCSACNFWSQYLSCCIAQNTWSPVMKFIGDFKKLKEYDYKQYNLIMEGEAIE